MNSFSCGPSAIASCSSRKAPVSLSPLIGIRFRGQHFSLKVSAPRNICLSVVTFDVQHPERSRSHLFRTNLSVSTLMSAACSTAQSSLSASSRFIGAVRLVPFSAADLTTTKS
eukprot:3096049-Rhodomonas_salina.1